MRIAMAAMLMAFPSLATAAPSEVLNKSVTISYTVSIPGKGQDGSATSGVRNATRTVYISSAGRAFGRVVRQDGRHSGTKELAPGDTGNTYRFEGNKLIGVVKFASGAGQMIVTFGQGGQSCSASIILGRDGGRPLRWKGVNGAAYEQTGPAVVSNPSCSVTAGNAFAGQ